MVNMCNASLSYALPLLTHSRNTLTATRILRTRSGSAPGTAVPLAGLRLRLQPLTQLVLASHGQRPDRASRDPCPALGTAVPLTGHGAERSDWRKQAGMALTARK